MPHVARRVLLAVDGWRSAILLRALLKCGVSHVCVARPPEDKQPFDELTTDPRVTIVSGAREKSLCDIVAAHGGEGFDCCYVSLVNPASGLIPWGRLDDIQQLRKTFRHSPMDGCNVEPHGCKLVCQAFSCAFVRSHAEVPSTSVYGLDFKELEAHRPSVLAIDIAEHSADALTDPVTMLNIGYEDELVQRGQTTLPVLQGGECHCVLCWYVELHSGGGTLDYGPTNSLYGSQMAIVPSQFCDVQPGDTLAIAFELNDSNLEVGTVQLRQRHKRQKV